MKTGMISKYYCFDLHEGCVYVLWGVERSDIMRLILTDEIDMEWAFDISINIDKGEDSDYHIVCFGMYWKKEVAMSIVSALQEHVGEILTDVFHESLALEWETEECGAIGTAIVCVALCDLLEVMRRIALVIERLR